jgi:tRNA pseudouridine55 synthase
MARKRKGEPVHGWLVLDKPGDMTSAQAVARVRRLFNAAKAGHAGTLDPMATGVLPIALGEATKTVGFVQNGDKGYRFTVRWGEARDTDDAEGKVTASSHERPAEAAILAALPVFTGPIQQVPPAYSAIKVNGERAYKLARADAAPALAPRGVVVHAFDLIAIPDPDHAMFEVRCGKGVYIRGLARDLALQLGCLGHVAAIRRTRVGHLTLDHAIGLAKLDAMGHIPDRMEALLPVETALDDIPALALTALQADYLRHGRPVKVVSNDRLFADIGDLNEGRVVCAMADGRPVALARFVAGEIRPMRVLNLE